MVDEADVFDVQTRVVSIAEHRVQEQRVELAPDGLWRRECVFAQRDGQFGIATSLDHAALAGRRVLRSALLSLRDVAPMMAVCLVDGAAMIGVDRAVESMDVVVHPEREEVVRLTAAWRGPDGVVAECRVAHVLRDPDDPPFLLPWQELDGEGLGGWLVDTLKEVVR